MEHKLTTPCTAQDLEKLRAGDTILLTGVVFGSTLFTIGEKVKLGFKGSEVSLFDRKSGKRIACGRVQLEG